LRLIAAPFYLFKKQIHVRYLWLLLKGAVPGLLVGTWALRYLNHDAGDPMVILLLVFCWPLPPASPSSGACKIPPSPEKIIAGFPCSLFPSAWSQAFRPPVRERSAPFFC